MNVMNAIAGIVIKELYRRKDFYVLFVITVLITLLMGSMNFFNESGVVRYLKEICLLLIWISSLAVAIGTAARQIPMEKENRTLFPLLAKPVSRTQLIMGKFLGCWWATGISLAVFYLFFGLLSGIKEDHWPIVNYLQAFTLHWMMLAVVIGMTLLGSLVFSAVSSNAAIIFIVVLGILMLGRHLHRVAAAMSEPSQTILTFFYYALPHLEWFDSRDLVVHNWAAIPWFAWVAALGYATVYSGLFLTVSCWVLEKKSLN